MDLLGGKRRQHRHECLQRVRAGSDAATGSEHERLVVENGHVEVLGAVADMRRQTRGHQDVSRTPKRLRRTGEQHHFVRAEVAKCFRPDHLARLRPAQPIQRLHLFRIGFSSHHDHGVTGLSNRRVERGNAVRDEDVARELQIDQRRVAGAQGVVCFVDEDLVWQPGRSAQRVEQHEHGADVLTAEMVRHSREIDDHADPGMPEGASKVAGARRGVLASERHDAG